MAKNQAGRAIGSVAIVLIALRGAKYWWDLKTQTLDTDTEFIARNTAFALVSLVFVFVLQSILDTFSIFNKTKPKPKKATQPAPVVVPTTIAPAPVAPVAPQPPVVTAPSPPPAPPKPNPNPQKQHPNPQKPHQPSDKPPYPKKKYDQNRPNQPYKPKKLN